MNIKILKYLQECIYSLEDNGNIRKEPIGVIKNSNASNDNIEKIRSIINIIKNSDSISEDTKIFISNYKISLKGTNEILNNNCKNGVYENKKGIKPSSYSTTVARIGEDENNLVKTIGENVIPNLLYTNLISDKEYNRLLGKLVSKYGVYNKLRRNLGLFIDDSVSGISEYKGSEDFFDILKDLEGYLIQRKRILEDTINSDKDFISYYNYLLSSCDTHDKVVNRDRERLMKFLNNEDYISGYTKE